MTATPMPDECGLCGKAIVIDPNLPSDRDVLNLDGSPHIVDDTVNTCNYDV